MKKENRNCGMGPTPYPIYQYPMVPNMQGPMMMPNMNSVPMQGNNFQPDTTSLTNQVNNLEKRVSALESIIGNNANYNNSNFQMM